MDIVIGWRDVPAQAKGAVLAICLLYTSDAADE